MNLNEQREFDELMRSAAKAENAALPFGDWKAEILNKAMCAPAAEAPVFMPKRKRSLIRAALPFAGAAAAVLVVVALANRGLPKLGAGAQAPAPQAAPATYAADATETVEAPMEAAAPEAASQGASFAAPGVLTDEPDAGGIVPRANINAAAATGMGEGSEQAIFAAEEWERAEQLRIAGENGAVQLGQATAAQTTLTGETAYADREETTAITLNGSYYVVYLDKDVSPRLVYYVNAESFLVEGVRWED